MILDNLFFFLSVSPIRASADLLCRVAGSPCSAIRALPVSLPERGREKVPAVGSAAGVFGVALLSGDACVPEEQPAFAWHGEAGEGQSCWPPPSPVCCPKVLPTGFAVPAPLGVPEDMSPHGTVLSVTCVPVSAVSVSVTGSSCQSVSALLRVVSARPGQECVYSVFWFLCQRQSVRNMTRVGIFLGAFPQKCNIWLQAQGSCAAPASPAAARSCGRPGKMLL